MRDDGRKTRDEKKIVIASPRRGRSNLTRARSSFAKESSQRLAQLGGTQKSLNAIPRRRV